MGLGLEIGAGGGGGDETDVQGASRIELNRDGVVRGPKSMDWDIVEEAPGVVEGGGGGGGMDMPEHARA